MNKKQFQRKCYEAYQLQWMINHGASLSEFLKTITDTACETMTDNCNHIVISSEEELNNIITESRNSFDDIGFYGCLFACEEEFLETEFIDAEYMANLLSCMQDSETCEKLYTKFTGIKLPDLSELQPDCEYHIPIKNGQLCISRTCDIAYPGLDIEYVSNKEKSLSDNVVFTRPRVLIENNNNQLRAVIWANRSSEDYSNVTNFICEEDIKQED